MKPGEVKSKNIRGIISVMEFKTRSLKYLLIALFSLIFFLFILFLLSSSSSAKTVTVDDDGNADFDNIMDAIISSEEYDVIFVKNGSYEGIQVYEEYPSFRQIRINRSVTLVGESKESTLLVSQVYIHNENELTPIQVEIKNFKIQVYGITIEKNCNTIIYNNDFENCYSAVSMSKAENIEISDNNIENCDDGIKGSGTNIIVDNNVIITRGIGINANYKGDSIISNNLLVSNDVGIEINHDITIENCVISNSDIGIDIWDGNKVKLPETTLIYNNIGISFDDVDVSIEDGTIKKSDKYDLVLRDSRVKISDTKFNEDKINFEDYDSKIELPNRTLTKYSFYGIIDSFLLLGIIIFTLILTFTILKIKKLEGDQKKFMIKKNFIIGTTIISIYILIWTLIYLEGAWCILGIVIPLISFIFLLSIKSTYNLKTKSLGKRGKRPSTTFHPGFLRLENDELKNKKHLVAVVLIFIYFIILMTVLIPTSISYNKYWEEQGSGARSPIGSGAEVCAVFLIVLFIFIYFAMRSVFKYRIRKSLMDEYDQPPEHQMLKGSQPPGMNGRGYVPRYPYPPRYPKKFCPSCCKAMKFVKEYHRYYCENCERYG